MRGSRSPPSTTAIGIDTPAPRQSSMIASRQASVFTPPALTTTRMPRRAISGSARRRCPMKDRKSTRLNSSHSQISYAVFCLKKKNTSMRHNNHHHDDHREDEHHKQPGGESELMKTQSVLRRSTTSCQHQKQYQPQHKKHDLR